MGIARGWEKRVIRTNITYAKRTVRIFSVSPQSRFLFSVSFKTFCFTARAHLNTQKYGPLYSLRLKLKREVSRTEKKVQDCVFGSSTTFYRRKSWMDLWKQMLSSKCSFTFICGIFWPLNPSTTVVYARSAFYPSLRFTLSMQSANYTQSAFYPWSAVCVLHWPFP